MVTSSPPWAFQCLAKAALNPRRIVGNVQKLDGLRCPGNAGEADRDAERQRAAAREVEDRHCVLLSKGFGMRGGYGEWSRQRTKKIC
jgi:hypothetical protein